MIETLISSKTRIKLLLKFFLNSNATAYLRGLESEFGESSNGIRMELNRFEKAGMLESFSIGNKKYFRANTGHPLFRDTHNIILKYIGFDKIIEDVIERLGHVERVYVTGAFAKGLDDNIIDLIFVGDINKQYLIQLIDKVESLIPRKIRYIVYSNQEAGIHLARVDEQEMLLLWDNDINGEK
ncbi:MAG: ArsR family transcriptional regulator [Saprospiraceae bacterium]|nr:ArsR family transcriptional regulator [Saprospiraceae bacterium]